MMSFLEAQGKLIELKIKIKTITLKFFKAPSKMFLS